MLHHLEEMAIFARVGEAGSISEAARQLRVPKSTVSRAVQRLEAAFRARLIERTTRAVRLTEVGRALHAHARAMVAEAENAAAEIAAYQGDPRGLLRVATPATLARNFLRPYLPAFLDHFPAIDVQLTVTDRLLNPVQDGFDVVIRVGWLEDSSVIVRKVGAINPILVASPAYLAAHGTPAAPAELAAHRLLGFASADVVARRKVTFVRGATRERTTVAVWSRFACNDPAVTFEMALAGQAIALTSTTQAADALAEARLVHLLPDVTVDDPPALYALYASRTALTPKVKVFLSFIDEVFAAATGAKPPADAWLHPEPPRWTV